MLLTPDSLSLDALIIRILENRGGAFLEPAYI